MREKVYVVGHGKLASRIQDHILEISQQLKSTIKLVENWDNLSAKENDTSKAVLVHCGSGRQLNDALKYCRTNRIPFIQCSTGITYPDDFTSETEFVLIDAPNLSIPIIKFLYLLEEMGPLFREYYVSITESHQKTKTSLPGTAVEMARLLGVDRSQIKSIRDEGIQEKILGIPQEYLKQHALHIIDIQADKCEITLRTEVHGLETYLAGLVRIINNIDCLPPGKHKLIDLIRQHVI